MVITETPYTDAVRTQGGVRAAARALGYDYSKFYRRLKAEERQLAKQESLAKLGLKFTDIQEVLPNGLDIKGTSTLYDAEGNKRLTWVKTSQENDNIQAAIEAAIDEAKKDIEPLEAVAEPDLRNADLLSAYFIADFHLGQSSWGEETGADWNLEIAERTLSNWLAAAIQSAPNSHTGLLVDLGDFMHTDNLNGLTPSSGHVLDRSGQYEQSVRLAIRLMVRAVQALLGKHQHVHVITAQGNHNLSGAIWMRSLLIEKFRNNPRCTFDNTPHPYYAYQWGDTGIYVHHGHKKKMGDISKTMVAHYREIFGTSKYSYAHVGHLHHRETKECSLMVVEQHSTLAPKDAHSAHGGYSSQRGASVITYSQKYGEVGRVTIRPEMIGG